MEKLLATFIANLNLDPSVMSYLADLAPILQGKEGSINGVPLPKTLSFAEAKKFYDAYQEKLQKDAMGHYTNQIDIEIKELQASIIKVKADTAANGLQRELVKLIEADLLKRIEDEAKKIAKAQITSATLHRQERLSKLLILTRKAIESPTDKENLRAYTALYNSFDARVSKSLILKKAVKIILDYLILASYIALYFVTLDPYLTLGIKVAYYIDSTYNSMQLSNFLLDYVKFLMPQPEKQPGIKPGIINPTKKVPEYSAFFSGTYGIYSEFKRVEKERYLFGRDISCGFFTKLTDANKPRTPIEKNKIKPK